MILKHATVLTQYFTTDFEFFKNNVPHLKQPSLFSINVLED